MNPFFPIYTEMAECQDCYKCLRACPVKAIQVEKGSASVIQDHCVMCGHCVKICPVGAKKVRNDVGRAKRLLTIKDKVIVSLAPSFITEFKGVDPGKIIHALKQLGFWGVSETALGAQEVSSHVADQLKQGSGKIMLSSACPTVVQFIKKYYPEYGHFITDLHSPVMAHTILLKKAFGENIGIVFVGPCISKKFESDTWNDSLDVAITFENLRKWLDDENINLVNMKVTPADVFVPEPASEGALYPVDGGMLAGVKANCSINHAGFMAFSGIENIERALKNLSLLTPKKNLFIELLACYGGCVNGPVSEKQVSTIGKRYDIIDHVQYNDTEIPRLPSVDIINLKYIEPVIKNIYDEHLLRDALQTVGKYSEKDELNCGGCGYDSCKDFARAMLDGKAEKNMCVSYMRQMAHKKANALLNSMPSGVVVVDQELKIVECNRNFVRLLGSDIEMIYDAKPGMEGALLEKILPFSHIFKNVLETGVDMNNKDIRFNNSIIHVTIFSIEKHRIVGGLLQDITAPSVHKEQIINRARKVIEKNLSTVQKIAYLLGENASETEVILDSIINSFTPDTLKKTERIDE